MKINILIPVNPIGKPRQTRSDKWKQRPCVMRYRAFSDKLRLWANKYKLVQGEVLIAEFHIEMPKSWSEKKKGLQEGKPHKQKPDLDNIIKAYQDSLCDEDSHIHTIHACKKWARRGHIVIHPGPEDNHTEHNQQSQPKD